MDLNHKKYTLYQQVTFFAFTVLNVGTIIQPTHSTVESRFKKARFKKESRFKKDCW